MGTTLYLHTQHSGLTHRPSKMPLFWRQQRERCDTDRFGCVSKYT